MTQQDDELTFNRDLDAPAGTVQRISPLIRRVVCDNPGPFTFTGTCTYIIGQGQVSIIDPGPDHPAHVAALLKAIEGETIANIIVTHTHRDHSPAAALVKAATGARIVGCEPHVQMHFSTGAANPMDASFDTDYAPDLVMGDGDAVSGPGYTLQAVTTPGHTSNHVCFALVEEKTLFTGDHVMAWSTSIVAPPDGSMGDYMASIDKLRGRDDALFWPAHGPAVKEPQRYLRALAHHRRAREHSILNRVAAGDATIPDMVAKIYEGLDPRLTKAAGLSVLAHLEDLVAREVVKANGPVSLEARYVMG